MDERDAGLIRFLMRERHGTPFEHNFFRFHVKCAALRDAGVDAPPRRSFNERRAATRSCRTSSTCPAAGTCARRSASPARTRSTRSRTTWPRRRARPARRLRAGLPPLPGAARGGRRQGGRAQRPAGRPLHGVLLVGQRAHADELPLAAQRGDGAARDPPLRRGRGAALRQAMPVTHAAFVAQGRTAP